MATRLHVDRAVRILLEGGVIVYPTEGVYGLGCVPWRRSVERVLAIKGRSWRKGLVLIAADVSQLEELVVLPAGPRAAEVLASWPGPTTWVLATRAGVPAWLSGGRPSLAVRVTSHPLARRLCEATGHALVSTSANLSGRPPARRLLSVRRNLGSAVDYVLAGPLGTAAGPTVIRDAATGRILRGAGV